MSFADRRDAGRKLAATLVHLASLEPVVLALPRGGVPVAAEVAMGLSAPMDLTVVGRVGMPLQPEITLGAVVNGCQPVIFRNEAMIWAARISDRHFAEICARALREVERRRQLYLDGRKGVEIGERLAIIVDDGAATGVTARAALRAARMHKPRGLIFAVPVASTGALRSIGMDADEVICIEQHRDFQTVSRYFERFPRISDEEISATVSNLDFTLQESKS